MFRYVELKDTIEYQYQVNTEPKINKLYIIVFSYVELKDAGQYQCQVNTEPKINTLYIIVVMYVELNDAGQYQWQVNTEPKINTLYIIVFRYVELKDAGEYQCQVNTEPKISFSFYLTVEGKIIINKYDPYKKKQNKKCISLGVYNSQIKYSFIIHWYRDYWCAKLAYYKFF